MPAKEKGQREITLETAAFIARSDQLILKPLSGETFSEELDEIVAKIEELFDRVESISELMKLEAPTVIIAYSSTHFALNIDLQHGKFHIGMSLKYPEVKTYDFYRNSENGLLLYGGIGNKTIRNLLLLALTDGKLAITDIIVPTFQSFLDRLPDNLVALLEMRIDETAVFIANKIRSLAKQANTPIKVILQSIELEPTLLKKVTALLLPYIEAENYQGKG